MSALIPITAAQAAEELRRVAFTVTDPDDSAYGRTLVHVFTGTVGADWDLDRALALLSDAQAIGWRNSPLNHDLTVVTDDAARYSFNVQRPQHSAAAVLPNGGGDCELPADTETQRITKALAIAANLGPIDGDHHKAWVIDQMVRALTGCPVVTETGTSDGETFTYRTQGKSDMYREFVAAQADDEGWTSWDEGIAP